MLKMSAHNFCIDIAVAEIQDPEPGSEQRAAPKMPKKCSLCRHPMKGHSKVSTCPKNQKKKQKNCSQAFQY